MPGAEREARETATLTRGSPHPGQLFPSGVIVRRPRPAVRNGRSKPVAGIVASGVRARRGHRDAVDRQVRIGQHERFAYRLQSQRRVVPDAVGDSRRRGQGPGPVAKQHLVDDTTQPPREGMDAERDHGRHYHRFRRVRSMTACQLHDRADPEHRRQKYDTDSENNHDLREDATDVDDMGPGPLDSANDLGILLSALGDHASARDLGRDTLDRRRHTLGPDHPDTLTTAYKLAVRLGVLGDHQAAPDLGADTLTRRRRVLGPDDVDTLRTAYNLAMFRGRLGRYQDAHALAQEVLAARRRLFGPDHPDTVAAEDAVQWWRARGGDSSGT